MRNPFISEIGLDIGTSQTMVLLRKQGVVLRQPSVVAIRDRDNCIVAAGTEALDVACMSGFSTIHPIKEGVIANIDAAIYMLKKFLARALRTSARLRMTHAMLCAPGQLTDVELQMFESVLSNAGVHNITLLHKSLASAMGAKLPVDRPEGFMVVDIGAGATEAGILSLNGVVVSNSLKCGGTHLEAAIAAYLRRVYRIVATSHTCEQIKVSLAEAVPSESHLSMIVRGRDAHTGDVVEREVYSGDVYLAIAPHIDSIKRVVRHTLEDSPPDLAGDLIKNGVMLTGGTSQIPSLARLIGKETGLPVQIARYPDDCTALGCAMVIDALRVKHPSYGYIRDFKQLQPA